MVDRDETFIINFQKEGFGTWMSWVALQVVVLVEPEIRILEDACSFKLGKHEKDEPMIVSIRRNNHIYGKKNRGRGNL